MTARVNFWRRQFSSVVALAEASIAKARAKDEDGDYEDEEVAAAAMLVKARRGDTGLMPALAALLVQSDENWDADILIARALGLISGDESLNMLIAIINREDPDEDTCVEAIRSLANREGTVARDAIKSLLDFDDENVQATAAAALLRYGDGDATKLIDAHFVDPEESDWDEEVLATALGVEGSAQALPYLLRLVGNEYWETRQLALRSLGATRLPEAKKAILTALGDDDEDVSVTAAVVLLRDFEDQTGVDLLQKTIENTKDFELRTAAVRALADLGRHEHAELLRKQFEMKATKVEHLPGKLWAAYAVLKTTK